MTIPSPQAAISDNEIYERIVSAILDHRLQPGTKLVEDKLGTAFGVSRTRIRPVLVRLANEQIVTLTPNRGACVAQPTEQEAREVFEARRLVEPPLLERFMALATADDIAALTRFITEEEGARASGDMRHAIRMSGDFHLTIAERAGQQTLGRILRELVSRTSLILMTWGPVALTATNVRAGACGCLEHRAVLDAIRLRDVAMATQLMREHLSHLEAQLQFEPAPITSPDLIELFGHAA
ncbi:GntR family transcriptional regulator [Rhodoferax sp.]|uniref:GntR family transcriptional regulator n=1 Tax=Rhodoferax sp. TaxID=50421 RepID=UPI00374C91B7